MTNPWRLCLWGLCAPLLCGVAWPADLYVAPNGNDAWSGRAARRDGSNSDGPLATLAASVAASRKQAPAPRRIVLAAGRYFLEQTLILDARDADLTIEGAAAGQTILYGGRRISGWRKDGDRFWSADVPEVRRGQWDFRALLVNDRMCPRARLPETGRMEHENRFPVRWMSTAGGGWERMPTRRELTTMQYRAGDLGPWLSTRNAEITVYHMWDESMLGLAGHDPSTRTLTFSSPAGHPPGAFGVNTYVVWNVREGMRRPGQWYLDREQGRIVYWPLPGENMAEALVVAPCVETILAIRGQKQKPLRNVMLRALTLSATTTPRKPGGFGAAAYRGALDMTFGQGTRVADLEIANVAGHALCDLGTHGLRIENGHFHHLGAGGLRTQEGAGQIENNRIHDLGLMYPSAVGLMAGGRNGCYRVRRNVIHHAPYSGMCIDGDDNLIEENLLHHCMQELQDGAAIYVGGAKTNILRRNVVRDVVQIGAGYGVSSYYLDEKCRDCVVENNISIGVARPIHNHMTLNCTVRDNVFVADGDMDLSFPRSAGFHVTGNTFQLNGKLKIGDPAAVVEWAHNLMVQAGESGTALSDAMPVTPVMPRQTPRYATATAMAQPPLLDGTLGGDRWPLGGVELSETPDQRRARGAPLIAKLCADATHLYVGLIVVGMFPEDRQLEHAWGKDEGVELALGGRRPSGAPLTYVLRGFADGTLESLTLGGATAAEAKRLPVRFAAGVDKRVWRCEWSVPLAALGFTPAKGAQLPFNLTVFRSEDRQFIQFAGTLGETWDLKRGGRLLISDVHAQTEPKRRK
jgi:hypothetical protein